MATRHPRNHASLREESACSRAELLRRGAGAAGLALAGVTAAGLPGIGAAQSPEQDARALNLLLMVEYAQVGFYDDALRAGDLRGERRSFAEAVLDHEREHLGVLRDVLGSAADPEPPRDFADAISDFSESAARLEDVAVAAYNGQAQNVSPEVLAAAAEIVSVEARHAAWIRSIAGRPPAPDASDAPMSAAEVREALGELGVEL
jgi:hypothetical protein